MNKFEIKIGSFTYGADKEPSKTAEIYIDGWNFCERVNKVENSYGHVPITIHELFSELTFWCKVPDFENEATVLGCCCGFKECSPLTVKVEETSNIVVWHSFFNEHKPELDYAEIEPFVFDKGQYYRELRNLRDAIVLDK